MKQLDKVSFDQSDMVHAQSQVPRSITPLVEARLRTNGLRWVEGRVNYVRHWREAVNALNRRYADRAEIMVYDKNVRRDVPISMVDGISLIKGHEIKAIISKDLEEAGAESGLVAIYNESTGEMNGLLHRIDNGLSRSSFYMGLTNAFLTAVFCFVVYMSNTFLFKSSALSWPFENVVTAVLLSMFASMMYRHYQFIRSKTLLIKIELQVNDSPLPIRIRMRSGWTWVALSSCAR